ncbi:MAG: HIRAN domain-containing protein [Phycisphaerales bacterium]|nr:HIRAN domain-containing protein [Phycisphaerales bacterium]
MNKALFIAWRIEGPEQGSWSPVGRLDFADGVYRFCYTRGAQTLAGFHPFPGMPQLDVVYDSDTLFPIFANRLLSESRPEYEAYLTWAGFDANAPPGPLAILGVTEGRRQTDSLEVFPCPAPDSHGCYLTKFFLHGIRWFPVPAINRISNLKHGDRLLLMADFMNRVDRFAVAVRTADDSDRYTLGYVPRYFARDFLTVGLNCDPDMIDLRVEQVNVDAPLQMRLLCRLNSCWPKNFQPCAGDDFQPIVSASAPRSPWWPFSRSGAKSQVAK